MAYKVLSTNDVQGTWTDGSTKVATTDTLAGYGFDSIVKAGTEVGSVSDPATFNAQTETVHVTSQTLSEQQKTIARNNIGSASDADVLKKGSQSLSSSEKTQVLSNLGISSVRNITISTSEPTSGDGNDGDIWLVYES